ncbi:hypothetical protein NDU88_006584 [Pleurodeles waltl]|uniref:Uncharacterized protein n=1 Tax=Pleurodeles waltl TaxID=8319 RepID=A0AAV7UQF1_PLEWA|nr:hypothetical protein NDU88_006584 [Pleurodeles waltl]
MDCFFPREPADDFQAVKKDLSNSLREVHWDLEEVGDNVSALEDQESGEDEEVEHLQQDVIRRQEQQIDLQTHVEDLENRSQRNNIYIKGVRMTAEGADLNEHVRAFFLQILEAQAEIKIQLDQFHRVGRSKPEKAQPVDILVCVHDFHLK